MNIKIPIPSSYWIFTIKDKYGRIKYQSPRTKNLNVLEGLIFFGDVYYGPAYSPYTATWFCGLCGNGTVSPDSSDTATKIVTAFPSFPTTNNWSEITSYVATGRFPIIWGDPDLTLMSGQPGIPSGNCTFLMNSPGTLEGGILISEGTKGGTTGKLYAVDNGAGSATYNSGDTIIVQINCGFAGGIG